MTRASAPLMFYDLSPLFVAPHVAKNQKMTSDEDRDVGADWPNGNGMAPSSIVRAHSTAITRPCSRGVSRSLYPRSRLAPGSLPARSRLAPGSLPSSTAHHRIDFVSIVY
jgi:hypothetical protein